MKPVSEVTGKVVVESQQPTTLTTSSSTARPRLPDRWIGSLFAKLQARYGLSFSQQWPSAELRELAMQEWAERLGELSGEQIKHGLERWDGKWPPNVEEFRKACIGDSGDWEHRGQAYKPFPPALPKPKARKEVVDAEMVKIRKMLGNEAGSA